MNDAAVIPVRESVVIRLSYEMAKITGGANIDSHNSDFNSKDVLTRANASDVSLTIGADMSFEGMLRHIHKKRAIRIEGGWNSKSGGLPT
jgi:hypothetical protein